MAEGGDRAGPTVVFVGLGQLGGQLVRHLRPVADKRAVPLLVHDRNAKRQAAVCEELGLQGFADFDELADGPAVLCLCVPDKHAVEDVVGRAEERGALAGGAVLDFSSVPPDFAQGTADRLAERGIPYLDVPLTGGMLAATAGEMVAMVGGDRATLAHHEWIVRSFSSRVVWTGASGNGALLKTVNNMIGNMAALAAMEGITILRRAGLEDEAMLEVLNNGPAATYFSQVRYPKFVVPGRRPSGARLGLVNKDLDIALTAAKNLECFPALSMLGTQMWHTALAKYGGDGDMLQMLDVVAEMVAGVPWEVVTGSGEED